MSIPISRYVPLKHYYPLPVECLSIDVENLKHVASTHDRKGLLHRVHMGLYRAELPTIGDVLERDCNFFEHIRAFGEISLRYLLGLLQRIFEDPQGFCDKVNEIELSKASLATSLFIESASQKSKRVEEIKKRMRELGYIT